MCYEIAHPACVQRLCPHYTGYINEDLPNSWECPMCCKSGKNTDYRPRHFRARQKSSDMRRMSISSDASSAFDPKMHQDHLSDSCSESGDVPAKKRRESPENDQKMAAIDVPKKTALRMQLAQQLTNSTNKPLKKPMFVVRPAPAVINNVPMSNLALDKRCVVSVFKYLSPKDLFNCALVCKLWAQYSIDPCLWKTMDFSRKRISSDILKVFNCD